MRQSRIAIAALLGALAMLIGLGLAGPAFRDRIDERERRATMALDEHIAFPHATLPGNAFRSWKRICVKPCANWKRQPLN